jgi:PAS domain-containing protein
VNIPVNCIFKSKEDAKMEHDEDLLSLQQITELEKAYELDMRIRSMLDVSPHANVLFSSSFDVIDCNSAAIEFMGAATKEVLLAGFMEYFAKIQPEFRSDGKASTSLREMLTKTVNNDTAEFETEVLIDNATRVLGVNLKKIPYEDSYAIVVYFFDVTEIHKREIELTRVHDIDEHRLNDLRNDIRAQMNSIIEIAERAQNADLPRETKTYLGNISDSAKQMLEIVN